MARRQRWNTAASGSVTGERSSIGDNYVVEGINVINKWCEQEIAMRVEYSPTVDQLIHMLLPDDVVAKLRAVRNLVRPASHHGRCEGILPNLILTVSFEHSPIPCPEPQAFKLDRKRSDQFVAALTTMKEIHEKYEVVKYVLRWLNRNATPGAVRYYFPAAMALCSQSPALMELQHVPRIHTTPDGISGLLPLIREAAGTVGACAMMRKDSPVKELAKGWVSFEQYELQRVYVDNDAGEVIRAGETIKTDEKTYYI